MLKITECFLGMRVMLTNPNPSYTIYESNPAVGSRFECEGEITTIDKDFVEVEWDNGSSNTYKNNELSLSNTGVCVGIW
jgi:hypothetical protein